MKKTLLSLLMLTLSASAFSQIELVETTQTEIVSKLSLVYIEKIGEKGDSFVFHYNNMNAPIIDYKSFEFRNVNNDFEKLYSIIMKGFEENPRDPYKIKANEDYVYLKYTKMDGSVLMQVQQFVEPTNPDNKEMAVSRFLTKEEVAMLFKK